MKNIYIIVTKEQNGKFYSYVVSQRIGTNLKNMECEYCDATVLHLAESRKSAVDLADRWNKQYKKNGTYMFQR